MMPPAIGPSVIAIPTTDPQKLNARARSGPWKACDRIASAALAVRPGGADALDGARDVQGRRIARRAAKEGRGREDREATNKRPLPAVTIRQRASRK